MARPTPNTIESTGEGWDAMVDGNFDLCFVLPQPLGSYASLANLSATRAAASYAQCIAVVVSENRVAFSDGSTWHLMPVRAAAVVNLTDSSGGTSGGNTIAAVTDVATAANAIATLAAKVNELMGVLRTAQALQ